MKGSSVQRALQRFSSQSSTDSCEGACVNKRERPRAERRYIFWWRGHCNHPSFLIAPLRNKGLGSFFFGVHADWCCHAGNIKRALSLVRQTLCCSPHLSVTLFRNWGPWGLLFGLKALRGHLWYWTLSAFRLICPVCCIRSTLIFHISLCRDWYLHCINSELHINAGPYVNTNSPSQTSRRGRNKRNASCSEDELVRCKEKKQAPAYIPKK